jgi:TolB-like protein
MDHHLVPLSRRAGIESVVEGRLREQGQRVRLLLAMVGRSAWDREDH